MKAIRGPGDCKKLRWNIVRLLACFFNTDQLTHTRQYNKLNGTLMELFGLQTTERQKIHEQSTGEKLNSDDLCTT